MATNTTKKPINKEESGQSNSRKEQKNIVEMLQKKDAKKSAGKSESKAKIKKSSLKKKLDGSKSTGMHIEVKKEVIENSSSQAYLSSMTGDDYFNGKDQDESI